MIKLFVMKKMILTIAMIAGMSAIANIQTLQAASHFQIETVSQDENGFVEMFQQGKDQDPYERKRPVADLYNTMNTSYQKIIKQLTDLLPKDEPKPEDDGFDAFVGGREDD